MLQQIVDSHCHMDFGGVPLVREDTDRSFDRYLARSDAAGITTTVVMASPGGRYDRTNRAVGQLVRLRPGRLLGYVFVNPVLDRGIVASKVAKARRWGACGIKVHWTDGSATTEIGEVARQHRLPVLFDPRGDIDSVASLSRRCPDVAWIVPHLSSFGDDWQAQGRLIDLLARSSNVFTDTSGVRYFDLLIDAVRRAGPHKVLFGSDGPFLHPGLELAKVLALGLEPAAARLVLAGNILRLTRHGRRPGQILTSTKE